MKAMYLMMVALLSAGVTLHAQDANNEKVEKKRMTQEERLDRQAKQLSERLMLDDKTTARFEKVYKDYQNDLNGLVKKSQKKAETDEEIEAAMKENWQLSKKRADIQEKYFNEFRKFLTVKQAQIVLNGREQFQRGGRSMGMPGMGMPGMGGRNFSPMFRRTMPGMRQRTDRASNPTDRKEKAPSESTL